MLWRLSVLSGILQKYGHMHIREIAAHADKFQVSFARDYFQLEGHGALLRVLLLVTLGSRTRGFTP